MAYVQHAANPSSGSTISATLPAAPTQGHLLVAWVAQNGAVTFTAQDGWTGLTVIAAADTGQFFWKVAGAGESATQTPCTSSGTGAYVCVVGEYDDMDPAPFLVDDGTNTNQQVKTGASITPRAGIEALLVGAAISKSGGTTFSGEMFNGSTTGVTERVDTASGSGNTGTSAAFWDMYVPSTSGTYQTTATASVAEGGGIALAMFAHTSAPPPVTGTLSAQVPKVQFTGTGTAVPPVVTGALSARLPAARSTITGTAAGPVFTGTLAAQLPRAGFAATGTVALPAGAGTLKARLPGLTASMTGTVTAPVWTGTLSGRLPLAQATAVGAVAVPHYTGTLHAVIPLRSATTGQFHPKFLLTGHLTCVETRTDWAGVEQTTAYTAAETATAYASDEQRGDWVAVEEGN